MIFALASCSGGDGSSAGSGNSSGNASESVRTPKGYYYTAILGDSITDRKTNKDIITEHYTDYLYDNCSFIENIQNLGYGGSCIAGLKDKANKVSPSFIERCDQISEKANLIIVFGGTNDFGISPNPLGNPADETAETFYGGLKILIDMIEEAHPAAKLVFVTPLFRKDQGLPELPSTNRYGNSLDQYAAAIKETCEKRNISCIDAFNELTELNAVTCDDYEVDGLHLNNEGNILLGQFLAKKLAEILD